MSDQELVDAAAMAVAFLAMGGMSKANFERVRPVVEGIQATIRPGVEELLTKMPWETAIWELAETTIGSS